MTRNYIVKQGDCLSSIAAMFGLASYRSIYDHPDNADLKRKRPNPNIVYPGDSLVIPDLNVSENNRPTDQTHRFLLTLPRVLLRIKLLDKDREPYKYKRYEVRIGSIGKSYNGRTSSSGLVEQLIPAGAAEGVLRVWLSDAADGQATIHMPLRIGQLDPVDEITGIQARLNHLRFGCGDVDGVAGPKTRAALTRFQHEFGLAETGEIDSPTREKLQHLHDHE